VWEETEEVVGEQGGALPLFQVSQLAEIGLDVSDVRGLATLSAVRRGREIRAVGFDDDAIERDVLCDSANIIGVLERHDA
jgi:hypothetical protein